MVTELFVVGAVIVPNADVFVQPLGGGGVLQLVHCIVVVQHSTAVPQFEFVFQEGK